MANKRGSGLGGPRAGMTDEQRAEETQQMLHARRAGASYAAIARQFGVSTKTVHDKVKAALADMPREAATELRALESQKLDYAEFALREQIKIGNVQAINTLVRISESRRRLLGLDMPEQHEVKITREEQTLAEQMARELQVKFTREADEERAADD